MTEIKEYINCDGETRKGSEYAVFDIEDLLYSLDRNGYIYSCSITNENGQQKATITYYI